MKKLLQFAGLISLALGVVAFILFMATPAIVLSSGNTQYIYKGTVALFGSKEAVSVIGINLGTIETKPSILALIGWILLIIGIIIVCLGVVLPLLKVKALDKYAGILNLVAVCALVAAGILLFCSRAAFCSANNWDTDGANLGAGWVIAGILSILGGVCAVLPAAVAFVGGKKK